MTSMIIIVFNIFSTTMFMQCKHPLSMTLMIIMQTLLICMFTGMISKTFWFSYILFLVFLGGMLVLFIYITSLASNELFMIPSMNIMYLLSIISITLFILWKTDLPSFLTLIYNNSDMNNSSLTNMNYWSESTFSLTKLYNNPTNLNTLMLMLYLFLTLIAIAKIINIFHGPLRPMH
uniref:NADH-ubiquinone oxidoreductase chain 6 n=1 Tax=Phryganogryllacris superangulata TaxID=2016114 RepID=A0A9E8Z1D0_9ORTH|nr:NADH dehydrogenase subunit 6 [Phryganogryllacris superangulata]WAL05836.1 NADH dehydrogenase subunit 6 [Phryganogryllacris superangulata]